MCMGQAHAEQLIRSLVTTYSWTLGLAYSAYGASPLGLRDLPATANPDPETRNSYVSVLLMTVQRGRGHLPHRFQRAAAARGQLPREAEGAAMRGHR